MQKGPNYIASCIAGSMDKSQGQITGTWYHVQSIIAVSLAHGTMYSLLLRYLQTKGKSLCDESTNIFDEIIHKFA